MRKAYVGFLLFALFATPTLSLAQEAAPVTNEYGFLSNFLSSPSILSNIGTGSNTRFPATAVQVVGEVGTAAFSVLPEIMAARRSYTPPIDLTTLLTAQY